MSDINLVSNFGFEHSDLLGHVAVGVWSSSDSPSTLRTRPLPLPVVAGWASSHALAAEISASSDSRVTDCGPRPAESGSRRRRMRQAVTNARALARLPSSSYEALSSYAAQTSASVELLESVAITRT